MFVDSSSAPIPHPDPGNVLRHGKKPWFPSYRGLKWRGIIFGNIWCEDGATIAHARPGTRHLESLQRSELRHSSLHQDQRRRRGIKHAKLQSIISADPNKLFKSSNCELCMYDIMLFTTNGGRSWVLRKLQACSKLFYPSWPSPCMQPVAKFYLE